MVDDTWCSSSGFLDAKGACRNPDGCVCKTIADLQRQLSEVVKQRDDYLNKALMADLDKQAAEADVARLKSELRNDQVELSRLMKAVPGAHFCNDWDGLLVWDGTPEAEACTCARAALRQGEPGGGNG